MKRLINLLLICLVLGAIMGCKNTSSREKIAQVRIFNAFGQEAQAEFSNKKTGQSSKSIEVGPQQTSEYQQFDPSTYKFRISSKNKELLKKEIGFAKNEDYTLILFGTPEFSSKTNQTTFSHKMHYIFEGEENYTSNGYLPNYKVFRDKIKVKKGFCVIRVFNAAVATTPINIRLNTPKKSKKLASKLAYAKPMQGKSVKVGKKKMELFLKGAPKPILSKEFDFKSKKIYTIVVYKEKQQLKWKILES